MAPLFVVQEIPGCDISEEMEIYEEKTGRKTVKGIKKLVGVLLCTPVIEWYLQHGLRLTAVHQLVEPGKPFSWFTEEGANARREADKDPLKKQLGDVAKSKRNSFYGKMIEGLGRHKSTKFTREGRVVDEALRSPFFVTLEEIGCHFRRDWPMRSKSLSKLL